MAEQRYKAVLAVISDGRTVKEVAREWAVSRQTLHAWLARYEKEGLAGLGNRSFRPSHCPHQMPAQVEVQVLEMRRLKPYWGARRLVLELARKGVRPTPSESAIYRSLVRAGVIDPLRRQRRQEHLKRWERAAPMELWQLDVVGGFQLVDGTTAKRSPAWMTTPGTASRLASCTESAPAKSVTRSAQRCASTACRTRF